jgi:hypothetical protein
MSTDDSETTTLRWEPNAAAGSPDVFVDARADREYHAGEHEVSDSAVARYLSHPSGGWSEVGAGVSEAAAELTVAHWNTITSAVEDGEADEYLDDLEALEANRENEPRESVLSAIQERRDTIDSQDGDGEDDAESDQMDETATATDGGHLEEDYADLDAALDETFEQSIRDSLDELDPVAAMAEEQSQEQEDEGSEDKQADGGGE